MYVGTEFIEQLISVIIVILLILSTLLTKKVHYGISGITLITLGLLPLLYDQRIFPIDITRFPIFNYTAYFFVIFASRDLFKEGMKEKESMLKYPSITFAVAMIVLTTIPTLYSINIISFTLPQYPEIINQVIYIVSGIFLLIGIFTLLRTEEK